MFAEREKYKSGLLTARIGHSVPEKVVKPGVQVLGLTNDRDGLLYIPERYDAVIPAALVVMLHGAGAPAEQGLSLFQPYADAHNIILIAPASRAATWDIIANDAFGPDVTGIDQALAQTFENYSIDPERIAIGGFSDGASYALSIGLTNGDLFTHIIAFSPGFAYSLKRNGKPAIFISHGVNDKVLPIDPCGRRIVPLLKREGFEVNYQEFEGGHEIPMYILDSAVEWFLAKDVSKQG